MELLQAVIDINRRQPDRAAACSNKEPRPGRERGGAEDPRGRGSPQRGPERYDADADAERVTDLIACAIKKPVFVDGRPMLDEESLERYERIGL